MICFIIPVLIVGSIFSGPSNKPSYGAVFVLFLMYVVYATLMISSSGQTVGNKAVGTRIVDARTGGRPSPGKALGRTVANVVPFFVLLLPLILDILWPLWDHENQTLHDKMAGTYVIRI
jgi:uncharacterized RDD family membrane protein YckC